MIRIICIGKVKESYFKEAILEYQKRISKYTKLEIIELSDSSSSDISKALEVEKEEILRFLSNRDYICSLAIEGKQYDSVAFSEKIEKIFVTYPNITFIIGGSYGLHSAIKEKSHSLLSFSNMTFPHTLFRVLLLEQIYRSYRIQNHETYHK